MWFSGQCHQRSVSSETGRANSWLQWLVGDGNKYIGHVVRPQEMKSMVNFLMEADTIARHLMEDHSNHGARSSRFSGDARNPVLI